MIEISNVISISVSQAPSGLAASNPNNVAVFTPETPILNSLVNSYGIYVSPAAVGTDWGTSSEAYAMASAIFSQSPNILSGGGQLIIFPTNVGETLNTAFTRVKDMIYFNGIVGASTLISTLNSTTAKAFADTVQAAGDKMWLYPSNSSGDMSGIFSTILNASEYATRCLLFQDVALNSRVFAAAVAGRAFSTNFNASNGTQTMNLKSLATISPDANITQTLYSQAATYGVDIYVSYAGVPAYVSNGANKYFDEVYNLIWFVNALKTAGFNALRQVNYKIPQTEPGMSLLKSAYRQVCEQALSNAYIAPGAWTSAERFGNPDDMLANIAQRGYYIYSAPVNQQSVADRTARKAPLIQIAIKQAGAVQQSSVVVNINA